MNSARRGPRARLIDPALGLGLLPSRRAFLAGAGVTLGLPALASLEPRLARAAREATSSATTRERARRFVAFYVPCGIFMPAWTPKAEGAAWELTPTLAPLERVKKKIALLTGLDNLPAREPHGKGDHACGTAGFLTCRLAHKLPNGAFRLGTSVDQVAANAIASKTRIASLQLGVKGPSAVCDPGYSCAYINNISWASDRQPLPKTSRPELVFDQIFEGVEAERDPAAGPRRRAARRSVLDFVLGESKRLEARLDAADRGKLDEYTSGIRELERRVAALAPPTEAASDSAAAALAGRACRPANRPPPDLEIPERIRAMLDLIVLAFRCDATRVVTFMMGNGFEGSLNFPFLGISTNHHPISHHQDRAENTDRLRKIDAWEVSQLAYLLEQMDAIEEADGTLLDSSVVFFSSEVEDGNAHRHTNLPIVVAGSAGGRIATGRHVKHAGQPVASLFVSVLQALGVDATSFGADGRGPLPGLTA